MTDSPHIFPFCRQSHIAGLKEAADRVKEDIEGATGEAKIALEDAWSGIQSLIADWEDAAA